jgi:hypothetical protein
MGGEGLLWADIRGGGEVMRRELGLEFSVTLREGGRVTGEGGLTRFERSESDVTLPGYSV